MNSRRMAIERLDFLSRLHFPEADYLVIRVSSQEIAAVLGQGQALPGKGHLHGPVDFLTALQVIEDDGAAGESQ